jgi:hypothetical protein
MIVYTAIYGSYDELRPHADDTGVEAWLCYTDDPDLKCEGWETVLEPARYQHPRLSAKWRKTHPPEGDRTLWLDGSIDLHDPTFISVIDRHLDTAQMTMFRHPWRDCIYDEVEASRPMVKYAGLGEAMDRQVAHYRSRGWAEHAGLWASTIIGRRSDRNVTQMGAAWFAHCETFTYQDQLSLPYLLDTYGISPAPLPHMLHRNPWYTWRSHRSEL